MPMIVGTLEEAGLAWGEVKLIGVTVGPGTFTGLRIGLAAARGMALASGVPVAGVTTFDAIAHAVPAEERQGRTLIVVIDSKRSELFAQSFSADLTPLGPPVALCPAEIAALAEGPVLLAGDGAGQVAACRPDAELSKAPPYPEAAIVAALAQQRFDAGLALPPEPFYLRPPDVTLPARS